MKTSHKIVGMVTILWLLYSSRNQDSLLLRLQEGECWKGDVNRTGILQRLGDPPLRSSYVLQDFLEGPGLELQHSTDRRAACKFIKDDHTPHFPHAMQQLYRCFSWWRAHSTKDPYLILPGNQPVDTEFLKGFIERLRDVFGVRVVHMRSDLKVVRPIYTYDWDEHHSFAMRNESDAHALRDGILERMDLTQAKTCNQKVRIRLLSRRKSRSIQNIKAIVRALEDAFLEQDNGLVESIMVTTFEEAPFRKQVEFLSQSDILIAAHGAELTGIPFQPRCAAVLELFPGGYAVPAFFGSLAAVSGVSHNYMYLGHKDMEREQRVGMR